MRELNENKTDLDAVLAHGQRPIDAVQFVVEAAGVAHGFAFGVAPPQRRRRRAAVGAAQAQASRRALLKPHVVVSFFFK